MAEKKIKKANGRPSKYKKEYDGQANKLCLLGYTNEELASFFDVAVSTVSKWISEIPSFSESLKEGRQIADGNVVRSLYHRAIGYSHPEDKVFNDNGTPLIVPTTKHYPPDTGACMAWLHNRQRGKWKKAPAEEVQSQEIKIEIVKPE